MTALAALASAPAAPPPQVAFSQPLTLGLLARLSLLAVAVVVMAFVVGRYAPERRRRLRRVVVPFGAYLVVVAAQVALTYVGTSSGAWQATWIDIAEQVGWLLVRLLLINAGALLLFELAAPRMRLQLPNIVHELSLGAAYLITLLVFLRKNGVDFTSLVATSAVVTAILAFSMQATLGNVFGGVTLQLDDSISVGDWIRLGTDTEGLVKEIRWRHVVLETRDWDTVILPNSSLMAQNITLLGKREGHPVQRRTWINFNVDFRYSPALVMATVERSLRGTPIPGIASSPQPDCLCVDLAANGKDSFAHYAVRAWISNLAQEDAIRSAIRLRIFAALKRANIPLAVPAATVFVEQADAARAERKAQREQRRRTEALARVDLFSTITHEEREQLAGRLSYAVFTAGETITRQGADAHWLYILFAGQVEIRAARNGKESVVGTIAAPGFFGEHGLMTGAPRSATVTALSEVECYRLDKEAVNELVHARPEVAQELAAILATRQQGLDQALSAADGHVSALMASEQRRQILRKMQKFFGLDDES